MNRLSTSDQLSYDVTETLSSVPDPESSTNSWKSNQLRHLAANPMFVDLRTTLRSEVEVQDTVPTALVSSIGNTPVIPVIVRSCQMNLRFLKLIGSEFGSHCSELQSFYVHQSAELETARYSALTQAHGNTWLVTSINAQYDHQHHVLLDRVELSLRRVEQQLIPKSTSPKATSPKPLQKPTSAPHDTTPTLSPPTHSKVGPAAIRLMQTWYDRNLEHPYPDINTMRMMANTTHITVEQVKKWFANRRQRQGHTKKISEIVNRRKRARTLSSDDIILEAAKLARVC